MQSRLSRNLDYLIQYRVRRGALRSLRLQATDPDVPVLPPEFGWRDYAIMLLHAAAEIEHSLMVQYLFAAYSMGGRQVPKRLEDKVRKWQQMILGIAKEEMGHLMTVQNVLIAMGAPIHFDRQQYPWGSEFYPFQFSLKRLSLDSLAEYVLAESAENWDGGKLAAEVKGLAAQGAGQPVNHVGALYDEIDEVLALRGPDGNMAIPDSTFQPQSLPLQASWDTWGRGYRRGERGQDSGGLKREFSPELVIRTVLSRQSARSALHQVAQQGEAPLAQDGQAGEESHFVRFLAIFVEMQKLSAAERELVARPVVENPVTQWPAPEGGGHRESRPGTNYLADEVACAWGHLFNLRYRMLLVNLAHSMHPIAPRLDQVPVVDRGIVINRTFAEMYNLRVIAGQLVELPLRPGDLDGPHAGPPFELPYTLDMPTRESNRWRLQLDLLEAAQLAVRDLLPRSSPGGRRFLTALRSMDAVATERVKGMLAGEEVFTLDERPA